MRNVAGSNGAGRAPDDGGGFVVLEAGDIEEAIAIASEWPSLHEMPNYSTVQLQPVFVRD